MNLRIADSARFSLTPPGASAVADAGSATGASGLLESACSSSVAVVVLVDFAPGSKLWGWSRMVRGPAALGGLPGLCFAKVLGSGFEGGFGLRPSPSRQGLFLLFDDESSADHFCTESTLMQSYERRSSECCVLKLRAFASRGTWAGTPLPLAVDAPTAGPIAVLTRASIRVSRAVRFWRMAPAAQADLQHAPGCLLAAGLGEAPLLRQATFSLWRNAQAMETYARSGAHLLAIQAAQRERFFSESMFVRFVPLQVRGSWLGRVHE